MTRPVNPGLRWPPPNRSVVPMTSLYVKGITREEHLAHLRLHPDASHLQIPEWADVKPDWTAESVGWFEGTRWSP